jgi:hypothetical protein
MRELPHDKSLFIILQGMIAPPLIAHAKAVETIGKEGLFL